MEQAITDRRYHFSRSRSCCSIYAWRFYSPRFTVIVYTCNVFIPWTIIFTRFSRGSHMGAVCVYLRARNAAPLNRRSSARESRGGYSRKKQPRLSAARNFDASRIAVPRDFSVGSLPTSPKFKPRAPAQSRFLRFNSHRVYARANLPLAD